MQNEYKPQWMDDDMPTSVIIYSLKSAKIGMLPDTPNGREFMESHTKRMAEVFKKTDKDWMQSKDLK